MLVSPRLRTLVLLLLCLPGVAGAQRGVYSRTKIESVTEKAITLQPASSPSTAQR